MVSIQFRVSETNKEYSPAIKPYIESDELLTFNQLYISGPDPPEGLIIILPSESPLQVGGDRIVLGSNASG